MTITDTTDPTVLPDTAGDKLGNARKAVAAGVAAAFAAAVPLFGKAILDGVITADEAGTTAAAFVGALVSVGYVTWQTVNKPKPSDVAQLHALAAGVPPIVVQAVPRDEVEYVGAPDLPADPNAAPVVEQPADRTDGPDHRAEPDAGYLGVPSSRAPEL